MVRLSQLMSMNKPILDCEKQTLSHCCQHTLILQIYTPRDKWYHAKIRWLT